MRALSEGAHLCLALQAAYAALRLKLDDELGRRHGLDFADCVLLDLLACADGGQASLDAFVRPAGMPRSAVLKRLLAMEKLGWVARCAVNDRRGVALRPAGRALAAAARETLGWIGDEAVAELPPGALPQMHAGLAALAEARAFVLA